jgi:ATP-dependent Clp protease ATP-binding subunit ClpB
LFIDELHLLVGAGKTDGAMDASNLLKPAVFKIYSIRKSKLDSHRNPKTPKLNHCLLVLFKYSKS